MPRASLECAVTSPPASAHSPSGADLSQAMSQAITAVSRHRPSLPIELGQERAQHRMERLGVHIFRAMALTSGAALPASWSALFEEYRGTLQGQLDPPPGRRSKSNWQQI